MTRLAIRVIKLRTALFLAVCAGLPYVLDLTVGRWDGLYSGLLGMPDSAWSLGWGGPAAESPYPGGQRLLVAGSVAGSVFLLSVLVYPCASWLEPRRSGLARAAHGSLFAVGIALLTLITGPLLFYLITHLLADPATAVLAAEAPAEGAGGGLSVTKVLVRAVAWSFGILVYLFFHMVFALTLVGWWALPLAALAGALAHRFAGLGPIDRGAPGGTAR